MGRTGSSNSVSRRQIVRYGARIGDSERFRASVEDFTAIRVTYLIA
jgi:hypothetical protein